eukprot:TRINITY_DN8382_c0_g1_i1.p1 TRINITY_DN8382_c0_g1~~TRINITY_DN8382_c0_g1_i1.p1  ORF type:complete len:189 (-),score=-16.99 TRINITY_DN8382_c0_g1_i1:1053-1619(-)
MDCNLVIIDSLYSSDFIYVQILQQQQVTYQPLVIKTEQFCLRFRILLGILTGIFYIFFILTEYFNIFNWGIVTWLFFCTRYQFHIIDSFQLAKQILACWKKFLQIFICMHCQKRRVHYQRVNSIFQNCKLNKFYNKLWFFLVNIPSYGYQEAERQLQIPFQKEHTLVTHCKLELQNVSIVKSANFEVI